MSPTQQLRQQTSNFSSLHKHSVCGCPRSCNWALGTKKASLATHRRPNTILYTKIKSACIRLSSKFSKQSALSSVSSDIPGFLLVNFLCAPSIQWMCFIDAGDHIGLLYSNNGRTYVTKALRSIVRSFEVKQWWIKHARWWALPVMLVTWSLKHKLESIEGVRARTA